MNKISLQPWQQPFVNPGTGQLTVPALRFLQDLYERAGGIRALTNIELADYINAFIAGEMVVQRGGADAVSEMLMQQADQYAQFPDVVQSAGCVDSFEMIFQG